MWLPPGVTREMAAEREAHTANVLRHLELKNTFAKWNRELKQIDPNLQLVKARDDTHLPGLKPGYWHVIRNNPGGAPGIIVHQGPEGEFREPDSGLFRELREGDLWDDRVRRAKEKRRRDLEKAEQRAKEREREERMEELMDRAKAAWSPSMRVPRSV